MTMRETLLLNNRFHVILGEMMYSFARVSNISGSVEVETVNEGGANECPVLLYKQKSQAESLVLERGLAVKLQPKSARLKAGTVVKGGIILVKNNLMVFKAYSFDEGIVTRWEMSALDALGKDVLIGIVDSGIDYENPDFRNADGTTRILALWDQTLQNGKPPQGYHIGTEFTSEQINEALRMEVREERYRIVPSRDTSGHGTAVAGIAAGNGRGSKNGKYRGAAPEAGLLIVKMGGAGETGFPRTTQLMRGVDYIVRKAEELKKPVAINISFGNTYGSHDGTSLLERYLNIVSERWKNVICVGSGNEGTTAGHAAGEYRKGMMTEVQLAVQQREKSFSLQIWKSYVDEVAITIVDPSGNHSGRLEEKEGTQRIQIGETELLVYYGEPKPYSIRQEIYISFLPRNEFVTAGVWKIQMMPGQVVDKLWQMWLPVQNALNIGTAFLKPDSSTTLTIPSTASLVITVAAYNALTFSYADFSGRGPTQIYEGENANKPDLAAPGVRVMAPVAGGGYAEFTGTSFATPFVTGSAALLMEWGIVKGNDPYLYGEKVKAYLRRGARQIPGYERWPNGKLGYGRLCIVQSIPGM